jgi:O-antigen ligase
VDEPWNAEGRIIFRRGWGCADHPPVPFTTLLAVDASISEILSRGVDLLLSPGGVVAALVLLAVASLALVSDGFVRLGVLAALFLSTLADGSTEYFQNILFSPLQQVREANQILVGVLLVVLVAATRRFPSLAGALGGVLVALFCFEVFYALRLFLAGQYLKGSLALAIYILLIAAFPMGLGRMLRDSEQIERLIRLVGLLAIPFLLANAVQFLFASSYTVHGGRFAGISGNPQRTALVASLQLMALAWMLSRPRRNLWMLPLLVALVGALAVLVVWTGSRTGMLATVVGVTVLFRRRIAAFVLVIGVAATVALFIANALGEVEGSFERLGSADNTRAEVWIMGIEQFSERPLFGSLELGWTHETKVIESTVIESLQTMGLVVVPLLAWVYWAIVSASMRLRRVARESPERATLADFALSVWCMLLVMSVFEAVFLGVATFFTLVLYLNGAITARLLNPEPLESELHDEALDATEADGLA